jgi:hypothetical protein
MGCLCFISVRKVPEIVSVPTNYPPFFSSPALVIRLRRMTSAGEEKKGGVD